jgi:hypothetical protein
VHLLAKAGLLHHQQDSPTTVRRLIKFFGNGNPIALPGIFVSALPG